MFSLLNNFDDVCTRLEMHVDRAMFVHNDITNETDEIDFDKDDRRKLKIVGEHAAMRAEIIFDYLWVMSEEIKELEKLVRELYDQVRGTAK